MKVLPKILYFICFVGLAMAAAFTLNRVVQPPMSALLSRAVIAAALAGAPGLIHRKAWPATVVLLPLGFYLLLRTTIPMPDTVTGMSGQYHFYLDALQKGVSTYVGQFFPLALTDAPELKLLIAVCVYGLVGVASFLALGLRKAVPAIALILVLLGFSLTVDTSRRVLWVSFLFLVLGACLLIFSRGIKRDSWRLRDALAGGAVGVVASFLALALLGAAPQAVAAPWQDWRAWDPFHQGGSVYSFNWLQNYPSLLSPGKNTVVMTIQSPSPSYWRANALDTFTGDAWISSQSFLSRVRRLPSDGSSTYSYSVSQDDPSPEGKTVTEVFQGQSIYTNYLFVGGDPRQVESNQPLSLRTNDTRALHTSRTLGPTLQYTLTAVIPELKPADLVGLGTAYPDDVSSYLALPFPRLDQIEGLNKQASWQSTMSNSGPDGWQWAGLYALDKKIVGGATDPYDITLRIEQYLRTSFSYSLTPPSSKYPSPYAAFLFDTHTGYCQHFAGAMALLLRYNGIPARVAVGFTTGQSTGSGTYVVSSNNAHAWVEAYFPTVGWVEFDPTPGRNIPSNGTAWSSSTPGFVNPFVPKSASQANTGTTDAPHNPLPPGAADKSQTAGLGGQTWLSRAWWLPWLLGLVIGAAAWPFGRAYWRGRRLRRGSLEQRLQASLRLLRGELSDYGLAASPSHTLEEMLHVLRMKVGAHPDPTLTERAEAVLFGGRPAVQADLDRVEAFRREVGSRLRKRYGWVRSGFTWYGVPRLRSTGGTRV